MIATTISRYVTNLLKFRFLEENRAVGLRRMFYDRRSQLSNSGKGECCLYPTKRPVRLLGPHSFLVSLYYPIWTGIKRPGREPNNSPLWSAEVMMLSTEIPFVLRFQLNEQQ